jgi:PhnB protein
MSGQPKHIPEGFHTLTPYLVCEGAGRVMKFVVEAFGAEERFQMAREDGTIAHASVRIGNSMVEMAEPVGEWKAMPTGVHLYVPDADEAYRRAIAAGGTSLYEPREMEYGDREGGVKDPSGNDWYIGTHKLTGHFAPKGYRTVTAGLSVKGATGLLQFLQKAFGADVVFKKEDPEGVVRVAAVKIGDSVVECSEAHGQWGPRTVAIHVYVPDVDAVFRAAIAAGASSLEEPKDQFYGERSGAAMDAWGNHWYIAMHQETLPEAEVRRRAAEQGQAAS